MISKEDCCSLSRSLFVCASLQYSAQVAVEDSDKVFDEMIRSVEKCHSDVKRLIRSQENAAVGQAEEQVDQLQKEIAELRRRDAELGQLSKTKDYIIFLQVIWHYQDSWIR